MQPKTNKQKRNELEQTKTAWQKILIAFMHKTGVKEITIDYDDLKALANSVGPGDNTYLITLDRKHIGPEGGFTLVLAYGKDEMEKISAQIKEGNPWAETLANYHAVKRPPPL